MDLSNVFVIIRVHNCVNAFYKFWSQKPKLTYLPEKQIAIYNAGQRPYE